MRPRRPPRTLNFYFCFEFSEISTTALCADNELIATPLSLCVCLCLPLDCVVLLFILIALRRIRDPFFSLCSAPCAVASLELRERILFILERFCVESKSI